MSRSFWIGLWFTKLGIPLKGFTGEFVGIYRGHRDTGKWKLLSRVWGFGLWWLRRVCRHPAQKTYLAFHISEGCGYLSAESLQQQQSRG